MTRNSICLTVVPKSRREGIFLEGNLIKVHVHASPTDGEANKALKEVLSHCLGVPKSSISLLSGEKSRHKIVSIEGWNEENLKAFLAQNQRK
ncbi:MAG: DUF167 domain-containing protein [Brevinematales bacterium]|nr:DUF167 domain-containing protein [Brevinematales bacterium]